MAICTPNCSEAQIRSYPVPCKRAESLLKGGSEFFILLDCDIEFTDITSAVEWEGYITANKVIVSPPGLGNIIKPTTSKLILSAGKPEEVISEISGYDFKTSVLDPTTFKHIDFLNDVKNLAHSKQLMWVECDGNIYKKTAKEGFDGLAVEGWRMSEDGSKQSINFEFRFETYGVEIKPTPLTDAIRDVLFAATSSSN